VLRLHNMASLSRVLNHQGMVALESKFAGQPFKILAFPCNEFLDQEPHTNSVVEAFARGKGFKGESPSTPSLLLFGSLAVGDEISPALPRRVISSGCTLSHG
jgi:hypothetical protein